ncbi:MAG: hypothetical protein JW969_15275 [Spirochaetales bacterium]|nr:hypothetical protein [Spirochaetales bacterium]
MKKVILLIITGLCLSVISSCWHIDDYNVIAGWGDIHAVVTNPSPESCVEMNDSDNSIFFDIQWSAAVGHNMKIELVKEDLTEVLIADKVDGNTGHYTWSTNVSEDNRCNLRFTYLDGPYAGRCFKSGLFTLTKWQDSKFNITDLASETTMPGLTVNNNDVYLMLNKYLNQINGIHKWQTHIYRWNVTAETWTGNLCDDNIQSYTFDMDFDSSQKPVLFYSEVFLAEKPEIIPNGYLDSFAARCEDNIWVQIENMSPINDANQHEDLKERIAPSLYITEDNHYLIFYITPPLPIYYERTCWDWVQNNFDVEMMEWDGQEWEDYSGGDIHQKIADIKMDFSLSDIPYIFDFFTTFSTSVVVDSGVIYIAYSDAFPEDDPAYRTFNVSMGKLSNGSYNWTRLDFGTDEKRPVTHNFSLAMGLKDMSLKRQPVVAYTEESEINNFTTKIIEWDGSAWNEVFTEKVEKPSAPSLIPDKSENPDKNDALILAYSRGVLKFEGGYLSPVPLGNPGFGRGDPSWWIGLNADKYFATFIGSDGKVYVKSRNKNLPDTTPLQD